ncbi:hypothetical protein [aff. Roholtiella sp. LEGE 12411]|uniref:hypothetical protein n=1 Tax=aff. Roholtiella sp. LEGE 12411 TaxID=1828822 RepID=UPI001880EDF0|nr:hypothetical protein [aff. Roholtiella sp. LEGE 12411]MBE9037192.1 hypothetical protein [aff. Roholtiella sp. LEGE 12411]
MSPQTLQTAITDATNAHTGLHQAIHELRHGSVAEAKQLVALQIAGKSECEACCCRATGWGKFGGGVSCFQHLISI